MFWKLSGFVTFSFVNAIVCLGSKIIAEASQQEKECVFVSASFDRHCANYSNPAGRIVKPSPCPVHPSDSCLEETVVTAASKEFFVAQ